MLIKPISKKSRVIHATLDFFGNLKIPQPERNKVVVFDQALLLFA
jgi:hypothetical protein